MEGRMERTISKSMTDNKTFLPKVQLVRIFKSSQRITVDQFLPQVPPRHFKSNSTSCKIAGAATVKKVTRYASEIFSSFALRSNCILLL